MPAQERPADTPNYDPPQPIPINNDEDDQQLVQDPYESDRSSSESEEGEKAEFTNVKLADLRKEVQCPICLGIIRKTRTVMECLHRFCRVCIDKSMRLGNNECPACRTHCASRRSLRDDPNYDALIRIMYPDIDQYEDEEWAFQEEEKARNKKIQDFIAQAFQRQSEALGRKRTASKAAKTRKQSSYQKAHLRRRRTYQAADLHGSDGNEGATSNEVGKEFSFVHEHTEVTPKRCKRSGEARFSQPSSAAANADASSDENAAEFIREFGGTSARLVSSSEILAWGKGGMRSQTRHGSMNGSTNGSTNGSNGKNAQNTRLSKLVDYVRNLEENNEFEIHLMLVSLDETRIPSLPRPYLRCRPNLSINYICQYVALQSALRADEIELYLVEELHSEVNPLASTIVPSSKSSAIDPSKDKLQVLREDEMLAELGHMHNSGHGQLLVAYQKKSLK